MADAAGKSRVLVVGRAKYQLHRLGELRVGGWRCRGPRCPLLCRQAGPEAVGPPAGLACWPWVYSEGKGWRGARSDVVPQGPGLPLRHSLLRARVAAERRRPPRRQCRRDGRPGGTCTAASLDYAVSTTRKGGGNRRGRIRAEGLRHPRGSKSKESSVGRRPGTGQFSDQLGNFVARGQNSSATGLSLAVATW